MVLLDFGAPMQQQIIIVTPQTRTEALTGLPAAVRTAFKLAEHIRCGTLEASLPDGRIVHILGVRSQ